MKTKNIFLSLIFVFIFLFGGYFIWRDQLTQKPSPKKSEEAMPASQNRPEDSVSQNNHETRLNDTSISQKPAAIASKNNNSPSQWQTYTNRRLGLTFQYPASWSKDGIDVDVINLSGASTEIDINFIDTLSKTNLLVAYHLPPDGAKLYDYVADQYRTSKGLFATGGKQIPVGGKNAFQSSTILSLDGKGRKLNPPLRSIIVDVQDYAKTGVIEFQFKTPSTNEQAEVTLFNQLLSGFKFLGKD
jgi:hypothetical protein